jgi:general stress protein CsbA
MNVEVDVDVFSAVVGLLVANNMELDVFSAVVGLLVANKPTTAENTSTSTSILKPEAATTV